MGSLLCGGRSRCATGEGSAASPLLPDADRVRDSCTCKQPCHPSTGRLISATRGGCSSKDLRSVPFPAGWQGDGRTPTDPKPSPFPACKGQQAALHPSPEPLLTLQQGAAPFPPTASRGHAVSGKSWGASVEFVTFGSTSDSKS